MRTTVNIDDELLAAARVRAHERAKTLGQYLEDAIRHEMTAPRELPEPPPLPVFRGGGLRTDVDWTSNAALQDLMDEDAGGPAPR